MQPSFNFKVITPQGTVFEGDVFHASIPAEDGLVGVLANHASYVTSSPGGRVELRTEEDGMEIERRMKVGSGFFSVTRNQAFFLTKSFELEI
jgi:F0F1-type ATP synthase epsilon subunit